jgi:magnesium transporter
LLTVQPDVRRLAENLRTQLGAHDSAGMRAVIEEQHPADLADAMIFLSEQDDLAVFQALETAEAAEVLDKIDATTKATLVRATPPDRLAAMLELLPADEGADILGTLPPPETDRALALANPVTATAIRTLLAYPPDTAGGMMSRGFVAVPETATQAQAIERFRSQADADASVYLYVVDAQGGFQGVVNLRRLLAAESATCVRDLLDAEVLTVPPETDQELVGNIFARYDLEALPVVAPSADRRLLGVITAGDVIDVLQVEHAEETARMAGSDAAELGHKSPLQVAKLRLPWLMATMFIELLAGKVIHVFDQTLTTFILLASFMPIISAISGNTGLQSARLSSGGCRPGWSSCPTGSRRCCGN